MIRTFFIDAYKAVVGVLHQQPRFFFIVASTLIACDHSMTTQINGNQTYDVSTPCGTIQFRARYFTGSVTIAQSFRGASYTLNPKKLKLVSDPPGLFTITRIEFLGDDGKEITDDNLTITGDKLLLTNIFITTTANAARGNRYVVVLPGDYITCNNTPLLDDSLKIAL